MVLNEEGRHRRTLRIGLSRRRVKKYLLLLVEVAAVIGLLVGAAQLWQIRQGLQEDLTVAREMEAAIEAGAQMTGDGAQKAPGGAGEALTGADARLPGDADDGKGSEPTSWWSLWNTPSGGGEYDG